MAIKVNCGQCGHSFSVKDEYAGRNGRCPQCKGAIQVPVPSTEQSPEFSIETHRPAERKSVHSKMHSKTGPLLALGGTALLVIACVALYFFWSRPDQTAVKKANPSTPAKPAVVVENKSDSKLEIASTPPEQMPSGPQAIEKPVEASTNAAGNLEIPVPNFSFEESELRDEDSPGAEPVYTSATDYNTTDVPGWIARFSKVVGTAGAIDPGNGRFAGAGGNQGEKSLPGTGHAHRAAFITHSAGESCLTTIQALTKVSANTTYTATVAVGYSLNSPSPGTVTLKLLAGNRIAAMKEIKPAEIKQGDLTDFSVSFTTGPKSSLIGEDLRLRILVSGDVSATGFAQATFDHVRLNSAPDNASQVAQAEVNNYPIEQFADPLDINKPRVFGHVSVVPHFEPNAAPTRATKLRYHFCVAENDCYYRDNLPAWKIAFMFHCLRGPGRPNTYVFETNLYSGRTEYPHLSRVTTGEPSVQKLFEAQASLYLSVPDNGREGTVGAKSRSPEMFPTIDLEIDGFKDLWKREQVSQTSLNGKEVFIETERLGLASELTDWNVRDQLPEGQYRIWRVKATWDDKSHSVEFALPDDAAQYYSPQEFIGIATEAFYYHQGLLLIYYWDFTYMEEGGTAWTPITSWKVRYSDADPEVNTWGAKVAKYHGRPALEISNDGTKTYAQMGDILEVK